MNNKMDPFKAQQLILRWFRHHNIRSHSQIKKALESLNVENRNTWYDIFTPLLTMGFIEYIGKNKYQISSPVVICDDNQKNVTAVNLDSTATKKLLDKFPKLEKNQWENITGRIDSQKIVTYCLDEGITCSNTKTILPLLKRIPSILSSLKCHPLSEPLSTAFYYSIQDLKWIQVKDMKEPGIYKATDDSFAIRYFLDDDLKLHKLPSIEENIDIYNLAFSCANLLNGRKNLKYNNKECQLIVDNWCFPILLERILWLQYWCSEDKPYKKDGKIIYPNISIPTFKELNRIFSNQIDQKN